MRRADADVYYQNCGECVTGQVALWCRRARRRFVFSTASDADSDPRLPHVPGLAERILYRYGIRNADRIIVQTDTQRARLRDAFGLDSVAIPMPCQGPAPAEFSPRAGPPSDRILWIAKTTRGKRPDRLLDLAEACPTLSFDLVGPSFDDPFSRGICERARTIANVTVHGPIPRDRLGEFYGKAACFCCTSECEGFPNTFLEAWSYGLPIVSTFDPDGLIRRRAMGFVASDLPGLIEGLGNVLSSRERYGQMSLNARRYYLENHTPEAVMPRFERVFQDVLVAERSESQTGNNGRRPDSKS
jgi:glycosyltransferase involved in cell wall biosynthesis